MSTNQYGYGNHVKWCSRKIRSGKTVIGCATGHLSAMILENFQKTFDTEKVLHLLGAKKGCRVSPASLRRIDLLTGKMEKMLQPQLSYRILELKEVSRGHMLLSDGTRFKSSKISTVVARAEKVCCFLTTVGPALDMEIKRLMQQKRHADAYVLDAMGSMSAENIVEQFYQRMARRQAEKNGGVTLRFSPGYCDWSIRQQRRLFKLFTKADSLNVVLNTSCLMSPRKSISGLFGLLSFRTKSSDPAYNPCNSCSKRDCIARRSN